MNEQFPNLWIWNEGPGNLQVSKPRSGWDKRNQMLFSNIFLFSDSREYFNAMKPYIYKLERILLRTLYPAPGARF